jgi:hypothetical protein
MAILLCHLHLLLATEFALGAAVHQGILINLTSSELSFNKDIHTSGM